MFAWMFEGAEAKPRTRIMSGGAATTHGAGNSLARRTFPGRVPTIPSVELAVRQLTPHMTKKCTHNISMQQDVNSKAFIFSFMNE
jgi:hypothetical protein